MSVFTACDRVWKYADVFSTFSYRTPPRARGPTAQDARIKSPGRAQGVTLDGAGSPAPPAALPHQGSPSLPVLTTHHEHGDLLLLAVVFFGCSNPSISFHWSDSALRVETIHAEELSRQRFSSTPPDPHELPSISTFL